MNTSCDTLVALGSDTRSGRTLFAKNSDRPSTECQPLQAGPARRHASGATVRCTYLEIPEVPETLTVLGSRPWWIWGFEHGVNESGVAIGNNIWRDPEPAGITRGLAAIIHGGASVDEALEAAGLAVPA